MHYKTAIIGGTFSGLGFGLSHVEDSVLIESSGSLGWEFIDAMNTGIGWDRIDSLGEISKGYFSEMKDRLVFSDNRVHLPAMAPVLFQLLKESALAYHFLTHVVAVEKTENGFEIKVYNQNGFSIITADQILDTSSLGYRQNETMAKKFISATLHSAENKIPDFNIKGEEFELIKGGLLSEAFLKIEVDVKATWSVARKAVNDFWLNQPKELNGWELASVATRLDILPENTKGWSKEGFTWMPGIAFENPLVAMSKGESIELLAEVVA